jgi:hypothetical protein
VKAGTPHWAPNQLRHMVGTKIRREIGLEASQVVLGHAHADVTQIYASGMPTSSSGYGADGLTEPTKDNVTGREPSRPRPFLFSLDVAEHGDDGGRWPQHEIAMTNNCPRHVDRPADS